MAPDGTPNAGGRNAEHAARRTSSCAFADNVAAAAMRAYDAVLAHLADRDPSRSTERGQTVLAAVVAVEVWERLARHAASHPCRRHRVADEGVSLPEV